MFTSLYYRLRHGAYRRNDHGIKKFAERNMGQLIRKVTKRSANYREMNETLMVEKANLRLRSDELYERPMLDPGEFFSMRRRLWANTFIVASFIVAAILLNAIALSTMLEGDGAMASFLQWSSALILALVLTGGGLIITERLIEAIYNAEQSERLQSPTQSVGILWAFLLIGIQLSILGVADTQARVLAGETGGALVYLGFMSLAMLLPVIAGAVRWDAMRYIDRYKVTQSLREIESRLAQIDSLLRQNEEFESNFYKIKSISYWDKVNDFKTYKDNYNERNGITERIGGHFSQSYDAFQKEANKRYKSDIRDFASGSMRKLSLSDSTIGKKIGQGTTLKGVSKSEKNAKPKKSSAPPEASAPQEASGQNNKDTYLEPLPVR